MQLDLTVSPTNPLYAGLGVTEVGGRANLPNAMSDTVINTVGKAIGEMVRSCTDRSEVIITGPAPVQIYLVAFHAVLHTFTVVRYRDGKGVETTVAQHG